MGKKKGLNFFKYQNYEILYFLFFSNSLNITIGKILIFYACCNFVLILNFFPSFKILVRFCSKIQQVLIILFFKLKSIHFYHIIITTTTAKKKGKRGGNNRQYVQWRNRVVWCSTEHSSEKPEKKSICIYI